MIWRNLAFLCMSVSILSGCATTSSVVMTEEEASQPKIAMEKEYQEWLKKTKPEGGTYWNQPVNKSVACLLPISKNMLNSPNFKQYWDGDCKDGYAYGLGRDIVLSDVMHIEEIVVHDHSKTENYGALINRDYINKITHRAYLFDRYFGTGQRYRIVEKLIENNDSATKNINIISENAKEHKEYSRVTNSLANGAFRDSYFENGISYWHHHFDVSPTSGRDDVEDVWYINRKPINISSPTTAPYRLKTRSGRIKTMIKRNGAVQPLTILSTKDHWAELDNVAARGIEEIEKALNIVDQAVTRLEKQYLYKISQKNHRKPAGIDAEKYYEILNYYTDFSAKEKSTLIKAAKQRQEKQLLEAEEARKNAIVSAQVRANVAKERAAMAQAAAADTMALNSTLQTMNMDRPKTTNCYRVGNMMNCNTF